MNFTISGLQVNSRPGNPARSLTAAKSSSVLLCPFLTLPLKPVPLLRASSAKTLSSCKVSELNLLPGGARAACD